MFKRLNNLEGKVAVITGGYGAVGQATAKKLAAQKCRVVLLIRSKLEEASDFAKSLDNQELGHLVLYCDITKSDTINEAAAQVKQQAGGCNILINSASITQNIHPKQLSLLTDEIFDSIVTTNLRGVFATIRAFAPMLRETNDGLIINISSGSAITANDSNLAYVASKGGLNSITASLGRALAPVIRVLSIVPGVMETPTSGAIRNPGVNEKQAEITPLKRIGIADDVADTVEACCTHIRFATGTCFVVDGGRTA